MTVRAPDIHVEIQASPAPNVTVQPAPVPSVTVQAPEVHVHPPTAEPPRRMKRVQRVTKRDADKLVQETETIDVPIDKE